jgi:protein gp37
MKTLFNAIGWCHFTVNLWWGCAKVSEGCAHCYAETLNKVRGQGRAAWGAQGRRWLRVEAALKELRAYDARARKLGVRWRIFINSMADTFEDRPDLNDARAAIFATARELTNLDLLLLTKRPENVGRLTPLATEHGVWPRNVWLGFTAENQGMLNERWEEIKRLDVIFKLPIIFISAEPLLGPLNIEGKLWDKGLDRMWPSKIRHRLWVICGGESGAGFRAMQPAWAATLRDQCQTMGVPFYFKQHGGRTPKAGGRLLDGVEHNGFPERSAV